MNFKYMHSMQPVSILIGLMSVAPFAQAGPIELNTLYNEPTAYLEFINSTEFPGLLPITVPSTPPGIIQTEEYTGYTLANGQDIIEVGDSDTTAGDRADFDWVQENRSCETGGPCNNRLPVNHPGLVGAMGWMAGSPEISPHIDPGTGLPHGHSVQETPPGTLPYKDNPVFKGTFFSFVDVFSIISLGQDDNLDINDPASLRAAALDYVLDFGNTVTGASSPGMISTIWIPGWTNATYIDDYVARWRPVNGGLYDVVAIEPSTFGDQRTEIDAIKTSECVDPCCGEECVPEIDAASATSAITLLFAGLGLLSNRRRPKADLTA